MIRRPPSSPLTVTLFPPPTLFRSHDGRPAPHLTGLGGYVQVHDLVEVVVLALADLAGGHRRGTADRAIEQLHLRLHHGLAAGLLRLGELAFDLRAQRGL